MGLALPPFRILLHVLVVLVLSSQLGVFGDEQAQPTEMVEQFKAETVFWKRLEIARKIKVGIQRHWDARTSVENCIRVAPGQDLLLDGKLTRIF
jgi:hypothetical protein